MPAFTLAALAAAATIGTFPVFGPAGPVVSPLEGDTTYASQSSPGQVALDVQPRWEAGAFIVDLRANTHSVDLSGVDLAASMRVVIGDTAIAPVEAGSLNGHHARASVTFDLPVRPIVFAIEIRNVPDVEVRRLEWPPS